MRGTSLPFAKMKSSRLKLRLLGIVANSVALTLSLPLLFETLQGAWKHIPSGSTYNPSYYTGPLLWIPLMLFAVDVFRQLSYRTFFFTRSVLGLVVVGAGVYHWYAIFIPDYEAWLIILGCVFAMGVGLLNDIRFVVSRHPDQKETDEPFIRPEHLGLLVGFLVLASMHVYLFFDVFPKRLRLLHGAVMTLQEPAAHSAADRDKVPHVLAHDYTVFRQSSVMHGLSIFIASCAVGIGIYQGKKRANQAVPNPSTTPPSLT